MFVSKIIIYPIKSLDGAELQEARVTEGGILEFDRVFAIVDDGGTYVNGKRTPKVQLLRTSFDPSFKEVYLRTTAETQANRFSLENLTALNEWLSEFFEFSVRVIAEGKSGFPDDRKAFGPTITSVSSMEKVASWFPELTLESVRRRFRSNIELSDCAPFGEDVLFGAPEELKPFRIGEVQVLGHNPRQRCVVPTRDPDSGESLGGFQKAFMELRKSELPTWSNPSRFNHYYRFAINTSIPLSEAGKVMKMGDLVRLSE